MAYDEDKQATTDDEDDRSVDAAVKWLKFVTDAEKDQRKREDEDLRFQKAEGAWTDEATKFRAAVPAVGNLPELPARAILSVASLDEPIALVAAQERKSHLGVTAHPISEEATDDTAEIITGIYRTIQNDSRGTNVRSWAYQRALWAGRGAYKVDKVFDPEGGHPFDQKLVLKRIVFQSQVYFDPFAQNPDWSDGLRAMEVSDLPWAVYKRKYKKKNPKLAQAKASELSDAEVAFPEWVSVGDDADGATATIRVAQEWRVEITERTRVLLDNGDTSFDDDIPKGRKRMSREDAKKAYGADIAVEKVEEFRKVFWRVIDCYDVLEDEQEWDGQYIPLIPVVGRELQPVDGKREWLGMVANAKDAVRLTNHAASSAVEMGATEPRAPFQLDPKQIEGFEAWWKLANIRNWPYLPSHRIVDGQMMDRPERTQVDTSRLSVSMALLSMGRDFVQTATQTYDPALGKQPTAHRSGRAIVALQDQSVEANSPYLDQLANVAMPYEALVMLDLIPKIYDRPGRIARTLDEGGKSSMVMLNAPFQMDPRTRRPTALPYGTPEEQQQANANVANVDHPAKHYDLNKGRYGVTIRIGKDQTSRLAEGSDALSQLMQADPALVPVLGPEWAHFQDFPGARQVEKLLRKMRDHTMPFLSEEPPKQDPAALAAENAHLKSMLQQASIEHQAKVIEQQGKYKVAVLQEAAESERADKDREAKLAVAALQGKFETMQNAMSLLQEEIARIGSQQHERQMMGEQNSHEAAMATGAHAADMQAAEQGQAHALEQGAQSGMQAQQSQAVDIANQPPPAEGV